MGCCQSENCAQSCGSSRAMTNLGNFMLLAYLILKGGEAFFCGLFDMDVAAKEEEDRTYPISCLVLGILAMLFGIYNFVVYFCPAKEDDPFAATGEKDMNTGKIIVDTKYALNNPLVGKHLTGASLVLSFIAWAGLIQAIRLNALMADTGVVVVGQLTGFSLAFFALATAAWFANGTCMNLTPKCKLHAYKVFLTGLVFFTLGGAIRTFLDLVVLVKSKGCLDEQIPLTISLNDCNLAITAVVFKGLSLFIALMGCVWFSVCGPAHMEQRQYCCKVMGPLGAITTVALSLFCDSLAVMLDAMWGNTITSSFYEYSAVVAAMESQQTDGSRRLASADSGLGELRFMRIYLLIICFVILTSAIAYLSQACCPPEGKGYQNLPTARGNEQAPLKSAPAQGRPIQANMGMQQPQYTSYPNTSYPTYANPSVRAPSVARTAQSTQLPPGANAAIQYNASHQGVQPHGNVRYGQAIPMTTLDPIYTS